MFHAAIPHPHEGRFAIVTKRWARVAMDASVAARFCRVDETTGADGEAVWFWRRDAGAKLH